MDTSLKAIKLTLKEVINLFNWTAQRTARQAGAGSTNVFQFDGLISLRKAVNIISQSHLFETNVKVVKDSIIFTSSSDQMFVEINEGQLLNATLTNLKETAKNLYEILLKTVPDESETSINIKLPEITDFNELSEYARTLHLALTQVLYDPTINSECKIVSVENGSIWFNVLVGSLGLSVVASMTWAGAVIYKKIQEGRLLQEQVRSLKVKNESIEDIAEANKEQLSLLIQAEAEHINSEYFENNQNESIERIKNSIKLFADLIGKGAEIHPALIAPENVTNLFPDTKNLIGLESKIKRIANSSDN